VSIIKSLRRLSSSKGFTLVELLVVIAIIGVLATLILLQLGVARAKARDAKRIADVNQLRTAVELYFDDFSGSYPGQALCPTTVGATCAANDAATNWVGNDLTTYLSARILPSDPLTGGQYAYGWGPDGNGKNTYYALWTELERQNAPALNGDTDINSTPAAGGNWSVGGLGRDNSTTASEACTSNVNVDCVYDLGQAP
jgi:prepilin-type N-terminal cleavage/methylation domain-containing protein